MKRCVVEAARGSGIRASARNWQLPCLVQQCPARVVAETSGGRCQFRAAGRGQRSSAVALCGVLRHQCDHQVGMAPLLGLAVKGARVSCACSGPPERRPHRRGAACRHCTYGRCLVGPCVHAMATPPGKRPAFPPCWRLLQADATEGVRPRRHAAQRVRTRLKETVENGHAYANEHEHVCVMQPSGRGSGLRLPGRRVRWASGARAAVRSCVDPQKNQSDACAAASSAHSCAGAMSREDQSMRVFCKRWSLRASPSPAPSLRTDVDCIKA